MSNRKIIHINFSQKHSKSISGGRLPDIIDWDTYQLEQWARQNPGRFEALVQSTLPANCVKLGALIITGTASDEDRNEFCKRLFVSNQEQIAIENDFKYD